LGEDRLRDWRLSMKGITLREWVSAGIGIVLALVLWAETFLVLLMIGEVWR
jgi:hypothetical protein